MTTTGRRPLSTRSLLDPQFEVRKERRSGMKGGRERRMLRFDRGNVELRAKPNGSGGTAFQFEGYAAVFDAPFEMWDMWGDQYVEVVNQGAFSRTLNAMPDVPFLIGHDDSGLALARTRSGTMTLSQDSTGLAVLVPGLDGSSPLVQSLVSAIERGDMDEMSCAFVTRDCMWSPDYEQRNMLELDLHRGDVSVVVCGANDATAGSQVQAVSQKRPAERRDSDQIMDTSSAPDYNPGGHSDASLQCPNPGCTVDGGAMNSQDARYCDQCGAPLYDEDGLIVLDDSGVAEEVVEGSVGDSDALGSGMPLELLQRHIKLMQLKAV